MNKFFIWLEQDRGRTRKVVLMTTIAVFLLITIAIFSCSVNRWYIWFFYWYIK